MFNFRKTKPVVEFSTHPKYRKSFPKPVPAGRKMPEWYRKLRPTVEGESVKNSGTIKRCIPVLDAVSQGYVIPLWSDLHIEVYREVSLFDEEGKLLGSIKHTGKPEDLVGKTVDDIEGQPLVSKASREGDLKIDMSFPYENMFNGNTIEGHGWSQVGDACDLKKFELGKVLLKFVNPWSIKTPKGWSVLFKNPANNFSNDIHILEGVVDTDEYTVPVNFPFVWTGSEEGEWVIPRGTPLVQVIPFKRTDIELVIKDVDEESQQEVQDRLVMAHFDRYKTMFWHKKDKYIKKDLER